MVTIDEMTERLRKSPNSIVDAFLLPEGNKFRLNRTAKLIR